MGFRYFMAGYWWDDASIFEIINIKTLYAKGPIHGSFTHLFNIKFQLRNQTCCYGNNCSLNILHTMLRAILNYI